MLLSVLLSVTPAERKEAPEKEKDTAACVKSKSVVSSSSVTVAWCRQCSISPVVVVVVVVAVGGDVTGDRCKLPEEGEEEEDEGENQGSGQGDNMGLLTLTCAPLPRLVECRSEYLCVSMCLCLFLSVLLVCA